MTMTANFTGRYGNGNIAYNNFWFGFLCKQKIDGNTVLPHELSRGLLINDVS